MEAHPIRVLVLATLACLLPFVAKPFHIDDPMYLWAAEQIRHHPADFFGFDVVWTGHRMPMHLAMQNPPLASYVIAAVSLIAGMNEMALHLAFFIPAVLMVIGTSKLAREFCQNPALAGLLTIVTPVFVLCSATVTNDILMVCLWVWAVHWWDRGLRQSKWGACVASAALISLACMTKYPAMNVIPLLIAYTLLRHAPSKFLIALLIPVITLVAYELYTRHLYGRGLLSESVVYAAAVRAKRGAEPISKTFVCLCFTGGCLMPALLLGPALWRVRGLVVGVMLWIMAIIVLAMLSPDAVSQMKIYGEYNMGLMIQIAIWFVVGVGVLSMAAVDLFKHRDAESMLLALWIFGTFVFAGIFNWSVNGRSILPMVPAVAMVIARRLEQREILKDQSKSQLVLAGIVASLVMSMWLTWADLSLARATRLAAERIMDKYGSGSATVWFQGHWGFQYYMQQRGAKPWAPGQMSLKVNDLVVIPLFNSNATLIPEPLASRLEVVAEDSSAGLSVMNIATGAAFYSHALGPLPFVLGPVPAEKYLTCRINVPYEPKDDATSKPGQ